MTDDDAHTAETLPGVCQSHRVTVFKCARGSAVVHGLQAVWN